MKRLLLAVLATVLVTCAAQARPVGHVTQFCGDRVCAGGGPGWTGENWTHRLRERPQGARGALGPGKVVSHPAGCPRARFCGCGLCVYLFGKPCIRGGLAVAANWLRFPPAEPGPGMVAARAGHVFAILKVLRPGVVLAYDPNSGGHLTRIRERSLAGFSVRNPGVHRATVTAKAL